MRTKGPTMRMSDVEVGSLLKEHREKCLLMSQQDLASEMRSRGFKWAQATVWSIETGERPLRFTEYKELEHFGGFSIGSPKRHQPDLGLDLAIKALQDLKDKL